ncbi:MAG: hypothetical protein ACRDPK_15650 [Carbonactinosporaceae bacterium]
MLSWSRRALLLGAVLAAGPLAAPTVSADQPERQRFEAELMPVPHDPAKDAGSNATGEGKLHLTGTQLAVKFRAEDVTPGLNHLVHIHGETQARNECPDSLAWDTDGDGLISVSEGAADVSPSQPGYGPVQVSLTRAGDVSAASGGALDRMPTADADGDVKYRRTFALPAPVPSGSPEDIAGHLGDMAMVIHGHDLDGDGAYSNSTEATLPLACGEIVKD